MCPKPEKCVQTVAELEQNMRRGQGPNQEHTGSKQGPKLVKRHVNKPYTKRYFTKLDWAGGAMAHVGLNVAPPLCTDIRY